MSFLGIIHDKNSMDQQFLNLNYFCILKFKLKNNILFLNWKRLFKGQSDMGSVRRTQDYKQDCGIKMPSLVFEAIVSLSQKVIIRWPKSPIFIRCTSLTSIFTSLHKIF